MCDLKEALSEQNGDERKRRKGEQITLITGGNKEKMRTETNRQKSATHISVTKQKVLIFL